ncbi:vanillate O-demethylase oxidoreductase [Herbaspirillum rubrisubalbicans M1]|uniref:PDR/VanB family oxidoreductase n=1 Tax=Herbaspirillum rubrisubalbicans TaxID=80842 RepID=UPI00073A3520|nr:PDR/VanB family oxidoreductase [Herbaspirillum rubrisubalbicans]ALU91099.1 vanillate O-demethylase oxidoreductase [Herbaspirillum rubrisubalbicans M1]
MNVIIDSITQDTADIRVFLLKSADGSPLPTYKAGAHIDLTLGNGLVRQYSLCCRNPSGENYRIAVKRETNSRGGSSWLHEHAHPGTPLQAGIPRSAFGLTDAPGPHLLLAGGIGITPLLAMAYALLADGRAFTLTCFARDESMLPLRNELHEGPLAIHTRIFCGLDEVATRTGIAEVMAAHAQAQVYTCGPPAFMVAVGELASARYGADHFHQESFQPAAASAAGTDTPFMIRINDGREITVPAGQSALASLQEAGIDLACSCEVGVCGTCKVAVRQGQPDHRDSVLSAEEKACGKWFMPCVSRSTSDVLVLDI